MSEAVLADTYRKKLALQLATGASAAKAAYMAFGDGGLGSDGSAMSADSASDGLNHEILRKALVATIQEDDFSATSTGRIEKSECVGYVVSEAMLVDADGDPIAFKNFGGKDKEADEYFDISIKVKH